MKIKKYRFYDKVYFADVLFSVGKIEGSLEKWICPKCFQKQYETI